MNFIKPTSMRLILTFLVISFCVILQVGCGPEDPSRTPKSYIEPLTVFLVRHAEKVDDSRDPELSEVGRQRALELVKILGSAKIDYIHSSDYIRTRKTAEPIARSYGITTEIYDAGDLESLVQKLRKYGGTHLVVGHSNTTPSVVDLLGGDSGSAIDEASEYDRLYIVVDEGMDESKTILMRYGDPYYEDTSE